MKKNDAADVAQWLARETGHVPEADEGYGEGEASYDADKGVGLPNKNHERMRRFFDGLNVEQAMTERRRMDAMMDIDEAEMQKQALRGAIPEQTPPGGGY